MIDIIPVIDIAKSVLFDYFYFYTGFYTVYFSGFG